MVRASSLFGYLLRQLARCILVECGSQLIKRALALERIRIEIILGDEFLRDFIIGLGIRYALGQSPRQYAIDVENDSRIHF